VAGRKVWLAAGRAGLLGIDIDEKYGGGGNADYRLGTQEQRKRWLPGYCTGELITTITITEPGADSDLRGLRGC
jgi:long-chain-acyl-CoA dehydrogenase